ncbi:MAG: hypothetical protein RXQ96_04205 [Thermocladium sp.]|jgi:hypothetical protein
MSLSTYLPEIITALAIVVIAILIFMLLRRRPSSAQKHTNQSTNNKNNSQAKVPVKQQLPQPQPPKPAQRDDKLQNARPTGEARPLPPPPPMQASDLDLKRLEARVNELRAVLEELNKKLDDVRNDMQRMGRSSVEYAYAQVGYIPSSLDELRELLSLNGVAILSGDSIIESSGEVNAEAAKALNQLGVNVLVMARDGAYSYSIKLRDNKVLVLNASRYYDESSINLLKTIVEQYNEYSSH